VRSHLIPGVCEYISRLIPRTGVFARISKDGRGVYVLRSSFETLASQAPQDEADDWRAKFKE
jgi:hypothetical protein